MKEQVTGVSRSEEEWGGAPPGVVEYAGSNVRDV